MNSCFCNRDLIIYITADQWYNPIFAYMEKYTLKPNSKFNFDLSVDEWEL